MTEDMSLLKQNIVTTIERIDNDINNNIELFIKKIEPNYEIIYELYEKYGLSNHEVMNDFNTFNNLLENKSYFSDFKEFITNNLKNSHLSIQYINLLNSEIQYLNFYFDTEHRCDFLNSNIEQLTNLALEYHLQNQIFNYLKNLFEYNEKLCKVYPQKISQLKAFDLVKDTGTNENVVIIGANGSGKSSFSRNIQKILGKSIVIISAQKIFQYKKLSSIPIDDSKINAVHKFQHSEKMCKDEDFVRLLENDLNSLIQALISNYVHIGTNYLQNRETLAKDSLEEPLLERVIKLWHEIIPHREIFYDNKGSLKVRGDDCQDYDFMGLSDGEKAVFYYSAHILLAQSNSYIIIDEPENHLNFAVVNKMWNILEQKRKDCVFMYLTHNINFACSRVNSRKLWMKSYNQETFSWDIIPLPSDSVLPESLYMELLGSRSKVIFCEGDDNSSFDYKLYSLLFPEYTIKSVKGHYDVIQSVRAFNKSFDIHGNEAIGIIDRDYHTEEEINAWKKDKIYSLPIVEVENIFLDELILTKAKERFCCADDIQNIKDKLFSHFYKTIEAQVTRYVRDITKFKLMGIEIKEKKDIEKLKEEINTLPEVLNVKIIFDSKKEMLNNIYERREYEKLIEQSNDKSLCAELNKIIIPDYIEKILILLRDNDELINHIKTTYFSEIE